MARETLHSEHENMAEVSLERQLEIIIAAYWSGREPQINGHPWGQMAEAILAEQAAHAKAASAA